jgi:hypothetical protein
VAQEELTQIATRVPSETARVRIGQIVTALKVGAVLFEILEKIVPALHGAPLAEAA